LTKKGKISYQSLLVILSRKRQGQCLKLNPKNIVKKCRKRGGGRKYLRLSCPFWSSDIWAAIMSLDSRSERWRCSMTRCSWRSSSHVTTGATTPRHFATLSNTDPDLKEQFYADPLGSGSETLLAAFLSR
jgi:hypothetical protein